MRERRRAAIAIGAAFGAVGALSNVHVSLRTGWSLPVMLGAAVGAHALARLAGRVAARARKLSIEEALLAVATAQTAAFMTGGGHAVVWLALAMTGAPRPGVAVFVLWGAATAALGIAIGHRVWPLYASLPFPTGAATGTLLARLDRRPGEGSGGGDAGPLATGTALGAVGAVLRRTVAAGVSLPLPGAKWGFGIEASALLVGVGMFLDRRTLASMGVGAVVAYGFVAPCLVARGVVASGAYRELAAVFVWAAAAMLVVAALLALGADALARSRGQRLSDRTPRGGGAAVAAAASVAALLAAGFGVAPLVIVALVPLTAVTVAVAARSMGETDVVPTKALAPIAQAAAGALAPGAVGTNVVAPNATTAVALHAASTLSQFRAADAVGIAPGRLVAGQLVGAVVGSLAVFSVLPVVVPRPAALPTADLPAPGVLLWVAVSRVLVGGFGSLPAGPRAACAVGASTAIVLFALERLLPRRAARFVPSAVALGGALVVPASNTMTVLLGGLLRMAVDRRGATPETALLLGAGLVAGESLLSVVFAVVPAVP